MATISPGTIDYSTAKPEGTKNTRKTRIACYERVSTEEQAIRGYSIAAQKATLIEYCKKHGYIIIDHYTDEGVSGGKPAFKRPAMKRLLADVEAGLIDLVLFVKLDRWFRNVIEYFKTQEILEAHNTSWNAVLEDYETETANGRMIVTIMLGIAQQERERTSERIKAVNDYRRAKGEYLVGGQATPYGYKVENKHLVKDPETEPICNRLFSLILAGTPAGTAIHQIQSEYPQHLTYCSYKQMIYKPIYAGIYNGIHNFCPAYISEEQHKTILATAGTRSPRKGRIYLFTGLIKCPVCGSRLVCRRYEKNGKEYIFYQCPRRSAERSCTYKTSIRETAAESVLTGFLFNGAQIHAESITPIKTAQKSGPTAKQIEAKMRRLAETYTDGIIEREIYKTRLAELTKQLETARKAVKSHSAPPVELARRFIQGNMQDVYNGFTRQEKRRFWIRVLRSVSFDDEYKILNINFFDE